MPKLLSCLVVRRVGRIFFSLTQGQSIMTRERRSDCNFLSSAIDSGEYDPCRGWSYCNYYVFRCCVEWMHGSDLSN